MKFIKKILNHIGYYKKPIYESYNSELANSGKPYKQNGIWQNYYDNITYKDYEKLTDKEKEHVNQYSSWNMSYVEYLRYKQFCKDHKECMTGENGFHKFGAIGGGIVVSFMGTGLGNIVHCKCESCGEIYDITDNSAW